jgi:transcriptional regulator with XRE-family HTH domain
MQRRFFGERLRQEFDLRRQRNPRYSLRALAVFLDTDHSTLSQILRGARRVPVGRVRCWAGKLGIGAEETTVYIAAEHAPDPRTAERQHQLLQWTAEAMSVVNEPAHWHILRLSTAAEFRPDCRWIAQQIGVTVDQVNLALSRLLRLRLLQVTAAGEWQDATGLRNLTEVEFRGLALKRARELGRNP